MCWCPEAYEQLRKTLEFFGHDGDKDSLSQKLLATWKVGLTTRVSGKLIYHLLNSCSAKELRKHCLSQLGTAEKHGLSLLPALRDRARMGMKMQLI